VAGRRASSVTGDRPPRANAGDRPSRNVDVLLDKAAADDTAAAVEESLSTASHRPHRDLPPIRPRPCC